MTSIVSESKIDQLQGILEGECHTDVVHRLLYATDASIFREIPLGVCYPKNKEDLRKIVLFAGANNIPIIPRAAGTSLAGQVVGNGLIVDISKHLNRIIQLNAGENWVEVEPGVVLDELNLFLKPYSLFFGPETSTSNRCMMGGMVGNNSCGAHSIIYGSTREHTLSVNVLLSDGTEAVLGPLSKKELDEICKGEKLENRIYKHLREVLSNPENQKEIRELFPDPLVKRRNTGYAIDILLETEAFGNGAELFNLSKIIAGSEGTLALITSIKLHLVPLPPPVKGLICPHFLKREDAFKANLIALKYMPGAVEMMDHIILGCTKDNLEQQKNRFFIEGDPAAVLIIEFAANSREEILLKMDQMEKDMASSELGYHFPRVFERDIPKVWNLRKAGLGVLSNMKGDAKPVSLIEDTAVHPEVLPDYMDEFEAILRKYQKECVYHAHIGSGELHLRPVLNLRDPKEVEIAHELGKEIALLVKKYRGSLSGEHGDGRLRAEFIPLVLGEKNYELLRGVKKVFDPGFIFNPGKIIDAPTMRKDLRAEPGSSVREIKTFFDFSQEGGIIRATEKCNGSGDCRKSELIGGTMCPSYMATRDESTTTRARANLLREFLIHSDKKNPFDSRELYDILDLCLSCKGCKSECPSNVDMAKLKSEFLQHYHDANGVPFRSRLIAHIGRLNRLASGFSMLFNFLVSNSITSKLVKKIAGFAPERSIPLLYKTTLRRWAKNNLKSIRPVKPIKTVYLFVDEFTNYNDVEIGIKAIRLLSALGYEVIIPGIYESGRSYISKGFLRKAKKIATRNILTLKDIIGPEQPVIGIEPSAILSFRDEYPELVSADMKPQAILLSKSALMLDEFLLQEMEAGRISGDRFKKGDRHLLVHGHCQQKAIASVTPMMKILSFIEGSQVEEIPSGCCGMAGSFGFEKEHYELSMKVGELVLFPAVRKAPEKSVIVAPGTSCRHQIMDGTGKKAMHPLEILYDAMKLSTIRSHALFMNKKSKSMKALVIREFGTNEVLKIEDVPVPEPVANEVLVKVFAAAVNPVDYKIRNGSLKFISGKKFPRTLGGDIAGIVEKSFEGSRFQPGDKVFAMLSFKGGGYAEYTLVPEKSLAILPEGIDYESAAAIPLAGLTAFQSLVYKGQIKAGSRVLINGASGGVGHFAVQIARAYGATVTATCSARNTDFVRSLGADEVIDYTSTDVLKISQKFDVVFDAVASHSIKDFSQILDRTGIYVSTIPTPGLLLRQAFNFAAAKKAYAVMTKTDGKDLEILSSLYLRGKLRPFIEKTFSLEEGSEAHRMIETHRVKGKIVLKISE